MTVLTGDCRQLMPTRGQVDMIIADPPCGDTSLARQRRVDGRLPLGGGPAPVSDQEVER